MITKAIEEAKAEALKIIESGIPGVHLCGDDYPQMDLFVQELAAALRCEILEWNFGLGLVDFKKEKIPEVRKDTFTFEHFLVSLCNPNSHEEPKIVLVKNARFLLDGEANTKNLACLQQTLLWIKNTRHATVQKHVVVYCDEQQFIPEQLASLVHFVELKPPSKEELESIAWDYTEANGIDYDQHSSLAAVCKGMTADAFTRILKQAAQDKETFAKNVEGVAKKTKKQAVEKAASCSLWKPTRTKRTWAGLNTLNGGCAKNATLYSRPTKRASTA